MSGKQEINGKAFEYALLNATKLFLEKDANKFLIIDDNIFDNAKDKFNIVDGPNIINGPLQVSFMLAANKAIEFISKLEPRLMNMKNNLVELQLQPDYKGSEGDVRDLLIIRSSQNWELGISAKNNNPNIKSPRLSPKQDFFTNFGTNSSQEYKDEMLLIFYLLQTHKREPWNIAFPNKESDIYIPSLNSLIKEFDRLAQTCPTFSANIMQYFLGTKDHYKVIRNQDKQVIIEALNLHDTLNKSCGSIKPADKIKLCNPPKKIIKTSFEEKTGQKNTLNIIFDNGLSLSLRIHSGDSKVKRTGLKLETKLKGYPNAYYRHVIFI